MLLILSHIDDEVKRAHHDICACVVSGPPGLRYAAHLIFAPLSVYNREAQHVPWATPWAEFDKSFPRLTPFELHSPFLGQITWNYRVGYIFVAVYGLRWSYHHFFGSVMQNREPQPAPWATGRVRV